MAPADAAPNSLRDPTMFTSGKRIRIDAPHHERSETASVAEISVSDGFRGRDAMSDPASEHPSGARVAPGRIRAAGHHLFHRKFSPKAAERLLTGRVRAAGRFPSPVTGIFFRRSEEASNLTDPEIRYGPFQHRPDAHRRHTRREPGCVVGFHRNAAQRRHAIGRLEPSRRIAA